MEAEMLERVAAFGLLSDIHLSTLEMVLTSEKQTMRLRVPFTSVALALAVHIQGEEGAVRNSQEDFDEMMKNYANVIAQLFVNAAANSMTAQDIDSTLDPNRTAVSLSIKDNQ